MYNPLLGHGEGHTLRHRGDEFVGRYESAVPAARGAGTPTTKTAGRGAQPSRPTKTVGPCWQAITHLQLRKPDGGGCDGAAESGRRGRATKLSNADDDNAALPSCLAHRPIGRLKPSTEPDSQATCGRVADPEHVDTLHSWGEKRAERLKAARLLRRQQLEGPPDATWRQTPHLFLFTRSLSTMCSHTWFGSMSLFQSCRRSTA
eukprot:SAG11_NODE_5407_length_1570_cov_2.225017_2_plen_204_part_00